MFGGDPTDIPVTANQATYMLLDTESPTGSVVIAYGAVSTVNASVTLTIAAQDASGIVQMCVSNTTVCSAWEGYQQTKVWDLLGGDGMKTVYVWFMDGVGNVNSIPVSDSILLDTDGDGA
jgi:hypothetical protein